MRSEGEDWSPLWFEEDPTPGRVSEVQTLASSWDRIAERLHAQADAIGKQKEQLAAPFWSGLAAEMFREQLTTVANGYRSAAAKHAEAAQVCARWAADLASAQSAADAALEEAVAAQAEIEAQEAALSALSGGFVSAEATLAGLRKTTARWSGVTPPKDVTVPTAAEVAAAQKQLAKVEAELAVCRRRLDAAQERLSKARSAAQLAEQAFHGNERAFVDGVEAAMTGKPEWPRRGAKAFSPGMTAVAALDATGDGLGALGRLTPEQWAALMEQKPELVWKLLGDPPAPDTVAAWWNRIKDTPRAKDLIKKAPWLLGGLDGIPFTVRDTCNREMLKRALKDPEKVYKTLDPRHRPPTIEGFLEQAKKLEEALAQADWNAKYLPGGPGDKVAQLVVFGAFQGAVTAAVSMGNLDTASNVAVDVPGAESTIAGGMANQLRAARDLVQAAQRLNPAGSYAAVAWFGYYAPAAVDVGATGRAQSGGEQLARFLDGIHAGRPGHPPQEVLVNGHSYGSTTAAEALKLVKCPVDDFVSFGSVGFANGTNLNDLNAGQVYAGEAAADGTAMWGRNFSFWTRTDPRDIDGTIPLPTEGGPGTSAVTGHDLYPEVPGEDGEMVPSPDDIGYLSPRSTSLKKTAEILANGKMG